MSNKKELAQKYIEVSGAQKGIESLMNNVFDLITADPKDFLDEEDFKKTQGAVDKAKAKFKAELPKFIEENMVTPMEGYFTEEELQSALNYLATDVSAKLRQYGEDTNGSIKLKAEAWFKTIADECFKDLF